MNSPSRQDPFLTYSRLYSTVRVITGFAADGVVNLTRNSDSVTPAVGAKGDVALPGDVGHLPGPGLLVGSLRPLGDHDRVDTLPALRITGPTPPTWGMWGRSTPRA